MNRQQFAAATAGLSEAELRKALWTIYWRGTAAVRERLEDILSPEPARSAGRAAAKVPDPDDVLAAVQKFTGLVRSGAYLGANRAVRPKERSQWRFTFRRLMAESRAALAAEDPASAETALMEMIDLACELRRYEYVRSEDPIEAAGVVVSDEVAVLWRHLLDQRGTAGFLAHAPEQFLRWESRFGWTRSGWGAVSQREHRLSDILAGLLTYPDIWLTFTEHYLNVLDGHAAPQPAPGGRTERAYEAAQRRREEDRRLDERAQTMTDWHLMLLDRFIGTEDAALLDRLAAHRALGGPEQLYFRARLAEACSDLPAARQLIHDALERLPGQSDFLEFARDIDAPLPEVAAAVAASRGQ